MSKTDPLEPVCNCPPNSPFLTVCKRADPALVAELANTSRNSRKQSAYVKAQREQGNDVGNIHGLSKTPRPLPAAQVRPSDANRVRKSAKELTAEVLKNARNGVSIATQADSDKTRRIRRSSI